MGFTSICTAVYDYSPQSAGELEIKDGELLYILDKEGGDNWWKARKKAAEDEEEEPEGLIPNNYVESAKPVGKAKALYDYTRQTDEEVSFSEDVEMDVYDVSDPDWTLVGLNDEFGFAPAIYIELVGNDTSFAPAAPILPPASSTTTPASSTHAPQRTVESSEDHLPRESVADAEISPAARLAKALGGTVPPTSAVQTIPNATSAQHRGLSDDEEEEEVPALPARPPSQSITSPLSAPSTSTSPVPQEASYTPKEPVGIVSSPPYNRVTSPQGVETPIKSPGGFHLYNISEMVSVMGRRKKMPTTLGLNIATGTIMLSPEKTRDGPTQEWTADRLSHYSIEGKHVFLELVRPSKSLDLHAGAKDTAQEIVSALGEIAGAHKAEGIREVIAAASSGSSVQKKGIVLYDFMAQGDDEVTVAVGDEIIILDDEKSEEWWNVRRIKNGKEGVMPTSYIEVTGIVTTEPSTRSGTNLGRSTVEQNRVEEEKRVKEIVRAARPPRESQQRSDVRLPERGSSLTEEDTRKRKEKHTGKGDNRSRSKPDPKKTRTWTDRSGDFKVEAQFIGIADGKIHLHKVNGVKIAVPVIKMSAEDIEYVEKVTHESIEEHIPVADLIKIKRKSQALDTSTGRSGATIDSSRPQTKTGDYDWFDFFLAAGVGPHQCERYAQAMVKDSMDESVLPDITTDTLRALGLKEGDALKVMKHLDQRFGRTRTGAPAESGQGGIFSGPGGALINNRRSRPEANRQTGDIVDATAFEQDQSGDTKPKGKKPASETAAAGPVTNGFDDDAWEVKPSIQASSSVKKSTPSPQPPPSENMQALSLLDKPLEPTPAAPPRPDPQSQIAQTSPLAPAPNSGPQQPQQTGANPAFFTQLGQQPQLQPSTTAASQPSQLGMPGRQRPSAPLQSFTGASLLPPPPRPLSAPQNPQQNQFGLQPLQPQLTGVPQNSIRQASPGQSLDELTAQRMHQQFLQTQATGYIPTQQYGQYGGVLPPQPTGFSPQPQFGQYHFGPNNGNATGSPFADPRPPFQAQPTGFNLQPGPAPGSLNSVLPPALAPQKTGYQSPAPQLQVNGYGQGLQAQSTGFQQPLQNQSTGFGQQPQFSGFGNVQLPPVPPVPQHVAARLLPQKTGPAPNVKFGVHETAKLAPQQTGRRANLAHATPQNPFGF